MISVDNFHDANNSCVTTEINRSLHGSLGTETWYYKNRRIECGTAIHIQLAGTMMALDNQRWAETERLEKLSSINDRSTIVPSLLTLNLIVDLRTCFPISTSYDHKPYTGTMSSQKSGGSKINSEYKRMTRQTDGRSNTTEFITFLGNAVGQKESDRHTSHTITVTLTLPHR